MDDDEEAPYEDTSVGFNSALSPLAKKAGAAAKFRSADKGKVKEVKKAKQPTYALEYYQKIAMITRQMREISEVMKFYHHNNGCQHTVLQWYLSSGKFERPPMVYAPCKTQCSIFLGEWQKMYLPVYQSSIVAYLLSGAGSVIKGKEFSPVLKISDALWGNNYWMERIFDRAAGGLYRKHMDALFLSLIAAEIIVSKKRQGKLTWALARDTVPGDDRGGGPKFLNDELWSGMHLHPSDRKRKRKPEDLVKAGKAKKRKTNT